MKYRPDEGVFGNIQRLFSELTSTTRAVNVNKGIADQTQSINEDIMCELDDADRIANIEEALIELEEMITGVK